MKAKKALKRLNRVEELLSNVVDQYAGSERGVRNLLESAKASVVQAKEAVSQQTLPADAKKPPRKAGKSSRRQLTAEGRNRLSLAAKKRWALAKRKGINAVTGRPLSKTA